jgi:uncharacterized protein YbjT (DUF2867 family)
MRILLTGATGFVGRGVLQVCLRDPGVSGVVALSRSPSQERHAKVSELLVEDFATLDAVETQLKPFDACFYCAGALPVGVAEAEYRRVTLDLTTHVAATLARLNPGLRFAYVSGAYSDPHSAIMPLRVKGETERALAALPIRATMLRPGGILPADGVRSPHAALAALHTLATPFAGIGLRLTPGLVTTTANIGKAMLRVARMDDPPAIVENREINALAEAGEAGKA